MYLSGKIDESAFCDEFYYCYDLEVEYDTLTKEEQQAFSELAIIASRFSRFEEEHKKYPGVYYTREEVRKKIIETKEKLEKYFERLRNCLKIS